MAHSAVVVEWRYFKSKIYRSINCCAIETIRERSLFIVYPTLAFLKNVMICPLFFRYSLLSKLRILFHSLKIDFQIIKKIPPPPKCGQYFFLPPNFFWFLFAAILFASFAPFFVDLHFLAQPIYSIIDYFIVLIFYSHPSHFHIWMRSMGQTS